MVRAALGLGITRFKVTGGEPFARKGAADFIAMLKAEPGVACVTVTTNGTHLIKALPRLAAAGVDGVNVSLDAVDPERYRQITGSDQAEKVLDAVEQCAKSGIHQGEQRAAGGQPRPDYPAGWAGAAAERGRAVHRADAHRLRRGIQRP